MHLLTFLYLGDIMYTVRITQTRRSSVAEMMTTNRPKKGGSKGSQEKKKTAKRTHKMSEPQRATYSFRREEKRLRHVLKRNGSVAGRQYVRDGFASMGALHRIASESTFAGRQASAVL